MTAPTTTAHDDWGALRTTALLGTDRRPLPDPAGSAAARAAAEAVDRTDPAAALLDVAAMAVVRRRAGLRPSPAPARPEPAAADERPALPEAAARRLGHLLGGRGPDTSIANLAELLPQWLATARAHGYRLPPALVPALLDTARARGELRADAVALAGPLGRWLAGQNPDWRYVTRVADGEGAPPGPGDPAGDRIWQEGLFAERVTHLTRLRRADPAAGLALLRGTWATERAEDRLLFLDALQDGLAADDEPFLEAALGDRSKNVRATAAELLSTLPGSALATRMAERARACVRPLVGMLDVRPPTECDQDMQRDGIPVKSPTGRGQRSWWLGEIVAAAPLALWTESTGLTPGALLALPAREEGEADGADWSAELRESWARAAVRQHDAGWARALLGPAPRGQGPAGTAGAPAKLLAVLPEAERAAWTAAFVRANGLGDAFQLLGACATPWTPPLSTAVVAALERAAASGAYPWSHSGVLGMTERSLAPEAAPAVEALAADAAPDTAWADTFTRLSETLRLRARMLDELAPGGAAADRATNGRDGSGR